MDTDSSHPEGLKKKSPALLWNVIMIVALLIGGASIAYFDHKNTGISPAASKKSFAAAVNSKDPMIITINTRVQGDKTGSTAIERSDGHGNYVYTLIANGRPNTTTYTPDGFYICNDSASPCVKYPESDMNSGSYDPSGLTYTPAKIKILKNTAVYQGQQNCPVSTETCDVWSYGTKIDMKLFYVNTTNQNIVEVIDYGHFENAEITTHIAYDHKDVRIAVPMNYTNAPAGSQ